MKIVMRSSKYEVFNIIKKTNAKIFKDIEVGDILQFSVPLEYAGTGSGGTYAVDIRVENISKPGNIAYKTFNQLPSLLRHFELEEIPDKD